MKVYELMDRLSRMSAGAELSVHTTMTSQELAKNEVVDTDDQSKCPIHMLHFSIDCVEEIDERHSNIYVEMR